MKEGVCKFCGESKKLIDAHIVPEPFFTRFIKPEYKTRLTTVDRRKHHTIRNQKGFYDPNILCAVCDGKFGVYDKEAIKLFLSDFEVYQKGKSYVIPKEGFDYKKLKLFFISMLWRASISSLSYFEKVEIGPKYEDQLLHALKNTESLDEDYLPVFIFKFKHSDPIFTGIFLEPIPYRLSDLKMYKFSFAGFSFHIKVDRRDFCVQTKSFSKICLTSKRDLVIPEYIPNDEMTDINRIRNRHHFLREQRQRR